VSGGTKIGTLMSAENYASPKKVACARVLRKMPRYMYCMVLANLRVI